MRCTRSAIMATAIIVAGAVAISAPVIAGNGSKPPRLEFRGQAIIPTGTSFGGTVIGGLSSIAYDADAAAFYALSDDQGQFSPPGQLSPARFYTLRIDLSDGHLNNDDVQFTDVTTLLAPNGQPYPTASLDPEGLTLDQERRADRHVRGHCQRRDSAPGCAGMGSTARSSPTCRCPTRSCRRARRMVCGRTSRSRRPPSRRTAAICSSAWRGALAQDGPAATVNGGSRSRILRYNLSSGRLDRQYVYVDDPVAEPPVPVTNFSVNGLVELLPFNTQFMLAMERSFSVGAPGTGNTIKLYATDVTGADNVDGLDSYRRTQRTRDGQDAAARPAHARDPARQHRGHDDRAGSARWPSVADSRERQQLRRVAVHTVFVVCNPLISGPGLEGQWEDRLLRYQPYLPQTSVELARESCAPGGTCSTAFEACGTPRSAWGSPRRWAA